MNETLTIPRKKQKLISFKKVPIDALFLTDDNTLCQKVDEGNLNVIANSDGDLFSDRLTVGEFMMESDEFVKEILDIKKIILA
jgi:ABC-type uncharacterized transport system involved in gliding motility auxiliary subunit